METEVGDIVRFKSTVAGKKKYHLCISLNGHFLFLNSPKAKFFPGDYEIDCTEISDIPPTAEGKSIVSCSLVMSFTDAQLKSLGASVAGRMSNRALKGLLSFVAGLTTIPPETRDAIVDGLIDYVGL